MNRLSGWGKSEEKERAKKAKGENERRDGEGGVCARLAPLADLFSRFFPTVEPASQATKHSPTETSQFGENFVFLRSSCYRHNFPVKTAE